MVRWERLRPGTTQAISQIHEMGRLKTPDSCRRCHFKGNRVGAAAMILPAKGILCMPCHAATFSIGDTTTLLSLAVFLIGLVLSAAYWLSGSPGGREGRSPFGQWVGAAWDGVRTVFSRKIFWIGKALFLDVLLQRRLYGQSKGRWFVHSLIFVPFVFRFSWGMLALLGSLWIPEESWVWAMLDKNHPAAAFLFDLTGIMVIFGVGLALARGALHATGLRPGLPRQDRLALGLIAAVVGVGFILEGMRIAMTGQPEGSGYAVVGYIISMLLPASSWLTQIYGYIWYVHAVLTGVFVAYLPFSRLFHIMVSPVAIAINAVEEQEQKRQ
jgi:nitrate reductase gamma subunit